MEHFISRGLFGFFCLGLLPCIALSQSSLHPLDALRTEEYWAAYDVIAASGHLDGDTKFASILLHEPAKEKVLRWKPGEPMPREADVVLIRKGTTIEARVDLSSNKLEFWKELPGVHGPALLDSEILGFNEVILGDPRVKAALAKRGIHELNMVECDAVPVGFFAFPEQSRQRIGFADCAFVRGVYHPWGRYISGLQVEVDFGEKKVLNVFDDGVVKIPNGVINFEDAPEVARPGTKPILTFQPQGASFEISDGEVRWQNWHFRFRLDSRVGPVVSLVAFEDAGRLRSILYQGMMSELFVPYMDPSRGWSTRVFLDAGEFYPGGILQSLREGADCPANAVYFDGLTTNEKGAPVIRQRQACLFERSSGEIAWRHGDQPNIFGRPARTLVLRSAAVVGNYDYLIDWKFEQDGTIHVAVGATGIIETRPVSQQTASAAHDQASAEQYGQLVANYTLGVNHDHFFSFRLDLDVDGQNNTFVAHKLVRKNLSDGPRKSIWIAEPFTPTTEREAMMDVRLENPSMWLFFNPSVKGPLGHFTGYEIMPGVTAATLLDPEDGPQKVGAFSEHQLWVTPYSQDERYAGGVYPNSSKGDDGLAVWTKKNRKIENTDIVAWYTLGFHHVPRQEDWPVMPIMWHEFAIRPFHFFDQNPVLTLPSQP